MAGFQCPYCNMIMPISNETIEKQSPCFESGNGNLWNGRTYITQDSCIEVTFYKCPNCGQYTIKAKGIGEMVKDVDMPIRPLSSAKQYPEYIPKAIRQDYEEACAIINLSPKASATLSRRCLQGMIRDFWGISKSTLYKEIDELKDKIPADLWSSIDALRQLGNIGAHMEKDTDIIVDIDPNEAELLIKLIELLMKEWYINREERKKSLFKYHLYQCRKTKSTKETGVGNYSFSFLHVSYSANRFPSKSQYCFTSRHLSSSVPIPRIDIVLITCITLALSVPLGLTIILTSFLIMKNTKSIKHYVNN